MFWGYRVLEKILSPFVKIDLSFQKGGRVYLYKVNRDISFFVRRGTFDRMIIFENWQHRAYTRGEFSIHSNDVVVDIGAQIGSFSVYAADVAKEGKVFAFEPHPENYNLLRRNKEVNKVKNLFIFNKGVSDKVGFEKLYLSKGNSGGHSMFETDTKKALVFKTTTLSDIVKGVGKINFLKIDAEGAEYPILLNAPSEVFRKIDKIVLEYHDYLNHGHNFKEIVSLLERNGFKVFTGGAYLQVKLGHFGIIKAVKK